MVRMQPEVVVTSVLFGEDGLEINYFEKGEQNDYAALLKTMIVKTRGIEDIVADIQEALVDLVDHGFLILRNPPTRKLAGKSSRLESYRDSLEEEEEEDFSDTT